MPHKKTSFDLFLGLWNDAQNMGTPTVHRMIASWLAQAARGTKKRLLLIAFRGCGKSTLVGLFCAWLLCHDPDLRILIVAADEPLAENMLRHIRTIIETHPLEKLRLPKTKRVWSCDRLEIQRDYSGRDLSIRATGLHSNMTGARADVIICDDVEVPNTSDTPPKREKLRSALHELDFILVPSGMILYIGTPHAEDSLYRNGGFLGAYKRLEIPMDEFIWPERFSSQIIADIKTAVGPRIFASQMLLQPTALKDAYLDVDAIALYHHDIAALSHACYWDPAFGRAGGDKSVIAYVVFDENNHAYVHDLKILTLNPENPDDAASQQCEQVIAFIRRHAIRNLVIESNGIGQFLPGMLRQKLKTANVTCGVQTLHNAMNKNLRILQAFEALLAAKALSIHERVSTTGFLSEMRAWQPDTSHNADDALDAVAGALAQHKPRYTARQIYHLQTDGAL